MLEEILKIKEKAQSIDRKVLVVPNLSYGYIPVIPILDELVENGIEVYICAKVGSTDCHDNPFYLNPSLFKGLERKLVSEKPIIVVDGTQHIISAEDNHKSARYPDAYIGFLNYAFAVSEAFSEVQGSSPLDLTKYGRTEKDIKQLRESVEFKGWLTDIKK